MTVATLGRERAVKHQVGLRTPSEWEDGRRDNVVAYAEVAQR